MNIGSDASKSTDKANVTIQPKTNSIQSVKAPLKNYTKPFLAKKAGKAGGAIQNSSSTSNLKKSVEQYYTQPKKSKEVAKKGEGVNEQYVFAYHIFIGIINRIALLTITVKTV